MSHVNDLAALLKRSRKDLGLLMRDVAAKLEIDAALISRFESGDRIPTLIQIQKLASVLNIPLDHLTAVWMSEKIVSELGYGEVAIKALKFAEAKIYWVTQNNKKEYPPVISDLIDEIDSLKAELDSKKGSINFRLIEADDVEYTYESNRIEGNTLTLQETSLVVADGITISGKSVREHLEAINHFEAIAFIRELATKNTLIKESHVLQLHNLVLRGIDKENAGKYRTVPVRITGSSHIPPEPWQVPKAMEELFVWYNQNHANLHPLILAAEMHEQLVSIHPFIDGNGRTSRLLMNLILLQHGYAIANIKGMNENRLAYYQALDNARTDSEKTAFITFVLRTELDCLHNLVKIL